MAANAARPSNTKGNFPKKSPYGNNILTRLSLRETRGCLQHHKRSKPLRYFNKIPGRLGFRLNSLASEFVLEGGHVFLGFSKNGQFVLSYSLHLEADEHTAFPVYVYRLHWWHFVPNRTLRQVSEVRLFGEEEISHDLYLAFCEWPRDTSKVLIFGYSIAEDGDEKRKCYITITAFPSAAPCKECIKCANDMNSNLSSGETACLKHGFTVHTKFELAPPYPFFFPQTHLRIDGVAVMNTGDSLIAMSVELEDGLNQSTLLVSQDVPADSEHMQLGAEAGNFNFAQTSGVTLYNETITKSVESDYSENIMSPPMMDTHSFTEYKKYGHLHCFSSETTDQEQSPQIGANTHRPLEYRDNNSNTAPKSPDLKSQDPPLKNQDSPFTVPEPMPHGREDMKENKLYPKMDPKMPSPDTVRLEVTLSPCFIKIDDGTCSTESSCYSSPIILQNDSQCFTYSVRKYADIENPSESPLDPEDMPDDLSLAYHSVLPLEVHGTAYNHMTVITSQQPEQATGQPALVVKQLTFDVEQYINEAIRSTMDLGHRYHSFADYDAQILDVCPDSNSVIGMVVILVRARPPLSTKLDTRMHRYNVKMYQTSFKFVWNLTTGTYETIETDEFVELDQKECMKKVWSPGAEMRWDVQKHSGCIIPQAFNTSAHTLTNEATFKGSSLKTLIAPQHYVAIVL
ncbi:DDB1- and CUL4-associated factor 15-like [Lineus longissimus]|uniref:DDB1- and CUL4-associated factor 15-like n=1 Tax=Lineus longissimus TaxID=88925 RepID=UPI002B4D92D3